jgi:hypothetical protein
MIWVENTFESIFIYMCMLIKKNSLLFSICIFLLIKEGYKVLKEKIIYEKKTFF